MQKRAIAALFLVHLSTVGPTVGGTLKLVIFDELTRGNDDVGRESSDLATDGGVQFTMVAAALLGVKHFNNRRADLVPELGNLGLCNNQIEVLTVCDTQCFSKRSFRSLLEFVDSGINGVLGVPCSSEAGPLAIGADILDTGTVVSYWASSPRLADKSVYPTFTRLNPSDNTKAKVTALLMQKMGYKTVGLIYMTNDFGAGFKDAIFTELENLNIVVTFAAFDFEAADPFALQQSKISIALRPMKEAELNIIICITYASSIEAVAAAIKATGMDGNDKTFVWAAIDSSDSVVSSTHSADARAILNGAWILEINPSNPLWDNFTARWNANEFGSEIPWMNTLTPPHGLQNSATSCKDDYWSWKIPLDLFSNDTYHNLLFDVTAYYYDAAMAYGIASCTPVGQTHPSATVPTGKDLFKALLSLDYIGMSNHVAFDNVTGDRDPTSFSYVIKTMKSGNAELTAQVFGSFTGGTWGMVDDMSQINFRGGVGNIPIAVTPSYHDHNYLPLWLKAIGWTEIAVCCLAVLYCVSWSLTNANDRVVVNSQPSLLRVMAFGVFVTSFSILGLTADDAPDDIMNANVACMVPVFLYILGSVISQGALMGKAYRIYMIFHNPKLKRRVIKENHMIVFVMALAMIEFVILCVWVGVAPLTWVRTVTTVDRNGFPTSSYGGCYGTAVTAAFVGVVFGLHCASAAISLWAAWRVRDLPAEFQESKFIALAILSMAQIFLIALPTVAATYQSVIGRFVVMSTGVFITNLVLLGCMFGPKWLAVKYGNAFVFGSSTANSLPKGAVQSIRGAGNNGGVVAVVANARPPSYEGGRGSSAVSVGDTRSGVGLDSPVVQKEKETLADM